MSLSPGVSVGPYLIIEQIGRGGMAAVYKAYEDSLARHVAIKVLPEFFAGRRSTASASRSRRWRWPSSDT